MATVFVSTCMLCTKIASKLLHKDYVFTVVWAEISDSQHNMSHACAVYKYMICMIQAVMPVEFVCVPLRLAAECCTKTCHVSGFKHTQHPSAFDVQSICGV